MATPASCLGGSPSHAHQSHSLPTVTRVAAQSPALGKGVGTLRTIGMMGSGPLRGIWRAVCRPDLSCSRPWEREGDNHLLLAWLSPARSVGTGSPFTAGWPCSGTQSRADTHCLGLNKGGCTGLVLDEAGGRESGESCGPHLRLGGLWCQTPAWHHQDGFQGLE